MISYNQVLLQSPLFATMSDADLLYMIECFSMKPISFHANDYIICAGDCIDYLYLIAKGSIEICKETLAGNRHIIAILGQSQMFGEGIISTRTRISPVTVRTREETILFKLPYQKLMNTCHHGCSFHSRLIFNLMLILGEKNYHLNQKLELLMLKGLREKLASFLLNEYKKSGTIDLTLTMNRTELADYLNVSRPSMSRELGRMQDEGLISFDKNHFCLLNVEELMDMTE